MQLIYRVKRKQDLVHYASPYYDPQKAHEYYEEHKKLKGRSTSGLNEKGQAAATYVKSQLENKRQQTVASSKANMTSQIEARQKQKDTEITSRKEALTRDIEDHKSKMDSSISVLQTRLKRMSPTMKKANGDKIREEIAKLRADNAAKKKELQAEYGKDAAEYRSEYSTDVKGYREEHSANTAKAKEDYQKSYAEELDKIFSDSSMVKPKSSKKKSSSNVSVPKSNRSLAEIKAITKNYKVNKKN